jgi:hypothetical protein
MIKSCHKSNKSPFFTKLIALIVKKRFAQIKIHSKILSNTNIFSKYFQRTADRFLEK